MSGEALSIQAWKSTLSPCIRRLREEQGAAEGKAWEVRVIEAGVSLNGLDYPSSVLEQAAGLFRGLPVYAYRWGDELNHLAEEVQHQEPRGLEGNRIGEVLEAWWNEQDQAIDALVAIDDPNVRRTLLNTWQRGGIGNGPGQDVCGFSIHAEGERQGQQVTRIARGTSLDLVTRPAAGGRFRRLLAAHEDTTASHTKEIPMDPTKPLLDAIQGLRTEITELRERVTSQPTRQDPLPTLEGWLTSLDGESRDRALERVGSALERLGAKPQREERFSQLATQVKELLGHERVARDTALREQVSGLKQLLGEETELDAHQQEIETLRRRLREQAIAHTLTPLVAELGITDPQAAARLADLEAVEVSDDFSSVRGLREVLEAAMQTYPCLVPRAPEPVPPEPEPEHTSPAEPVPTPEPGTPMSPAAPVPLKESAAGREPVLTSRVRELQALALQGDVLAALELDRIRTLA